jgi:hypothetical protein
MQVNTRTGVAIRSGVAMASVLLAAVWLQAQAPSGKDAPTSAPGVDSAGSDALTRAGGLPPRATPGDYQFRVQAGKATIVGEFMGHAVPTLEGGPYTTEDFVMVETGFFGPPGTRLDISYQNFALRINGKKPIPAEPYLSVFKSLKDPDWDDPNKKDDNKTQFNTGGGNTSDPPRLIHMPIERQRTMQARVVKVSLGEGERPLPQAGILYFEYHSETKGIHTLELIYNGSAGKATLQMQK